VSAWWYVVGLCLDPATTAAEADEFDTFYGDVHVPEVIAANAGFLRCLRFARTSWDEAGERTPDRLTCFQLVDERSAETYLGRPGKPIYTPKPEVWQRRASGLWRSFWQGPDLDRGQSCDRLVAWGSDVPVTAGFSLYRNLSAGSAVSASVSVTGGRAGRGQDGEQAAAVRACWRMGLRRLG
jgi:hypothetical protein